MNNNFPTLRIPADVMLPDNDQWKNRFEIQSESSNRLYVIAQHKKNLHWGCSCMAWKRYRKCKHLSSLDLPLFEQPYNANISH